MYFYFAINSCGTIGSGIISNLVSYGVSDFILMDHDSVTLSNTTRQSLFSLEDVNYSKVSVLKKFIESRCKESSVEVYNQEFTNGHDLSYFKDVDVLIFAADSSDLREIIDRNSETLENILEKFSYDNEIVISFSGGYKGHTGRIFPIMIPKKTHSLSCVLNNIISTIATLDYDFAFNLNNNEEIILSSTSEVANFVSSIISFEIVKCLSEVIPLTLVNKLIYIEFKDYTIEHYSMSENDIKCICEI